MNFLSLLLPLAYLSLLIGSLATFSTLYRRRQAARAAALESWFPPHLQRNIYLSLLELQANPDATDSEKTSPKIPDSILKAALLRRAIEDIHRLISLRTQKPALSQLLQRGSVGDDLWQRFQLAEKEMDVEVRDVVNEANALAPQQQWGNTIFQSASEAAHREMLSKKLKSIESERATIKEDWERRKESVRAGFMKELDGDSKDAESLSKKTASSDEDAPVMVESVVPESPGAEAETPGGSAKKKKKGKN